jgi:Na+/H+ antiporter NhaC
VPRPSWAGVHQPYNVVPTLPGIVLVAVTVAIAVAVLLLVWRWSGRPGWGMPHQLALTAGALFTYAWNGFVTIPLSDRIDVAGQIAIDILAVALVIVVALSLARNGAHATSGAPM